MEMIEKNMGRRTAPPEPQTAKMSYQRILKTTFVMGGSSIVNTLLGVVRTKVLAVILGPSGIGLVGLYTMVTGLFSTISGLGIGESGVRQIAGAVGTGDERSVGTTIVAIRRSAMVLGIAGSIVLLLSSTTLSRFTFGNEAHASDLGILSLTIFFGAVSSGQTSLIQGMRRITSLAKLHMLEAFMGTAFSIPIIYWMGLRGIPYFILAVSGMTILASWWFARKIQIQKALVSWRETAVMVRPLLKLGAALMAGTLMIAATQYLLRVMIVHNFGLDAAGVYQASSTLSLVYVGIILNAMLTDFYPRLSEAAHDNTECTLLINKQVEVGLLLAVPGILAVMTCAPYVIQLFYSAKFVLAVEILRWQILGVMLQVVAWPLGFILRAKGNGKLFFLTELFVSVAHLGFAWLGMKGLGLPGAGTAFFGMNLAYLGLIYLVARYTYGFRFAPATARLLGIFSSVLGFVFISRLLFSEFTSLVISLTLTFAVGCGSLRLLLSRAADEDAIGASSGIGSTFRLNHLPSLLRSIYTK